MQDMSGETKVKIVAPSASGERCLHSGEELEGLLNLKIDDLDGC
jgi:hypothetical protein